MAEVSINIEGLEQMSDELINSGLERLGVFMVSEVQIRAPRDKGQLAGSIFHEVNKDDKSVRTIANTEYAAIQEYGGEISAKGGKALAVPIHADAEGKRPRDFSDLVMIKRKTGPPLLVRIKSKGKNQRFDIMFVLVKRVNIPAQPYLGPALYDNVDRLAEVFVGSGSN